MNNFIKILLFPISIIYGLITKCRNYFFDIGILKSRYFSDINSIVVGNLSVGGTGKTPHVEYIANFLKKDFKISILSRGYGRKTKGFLKADDNSNFNLIGDEPMQYYLKFKSLIDVFVCEKRVEGIEKIISTNNIDFIILDDAFQHRYIKADTYITLTDYNNLFFNDFVLPSGRLREFRSGINRSNIVVVTKCPDNISFDEMASIKNKIFDYGVENVFFSKIKYGKLVPLFKTKDEAVVSKVAILTGIAKPQLLVDYIDENYQIIKHFQFSDHHSFSEKEIDTLIEFYHKNNLDAIITTEKDAVRLREFSKLVSIPIYFQTIEVDFIEDKEAFNQMIKSVLK